MPSKTNTDRKSSKQEYEEQPGWASLFLRETTSDKQPKYTGTGLDPEGNEIQVAIWPKRAKSGAKYLRLHIEPPYEAEDDGDDEDEDDIPF